MGLSSLSGMVRGNELVNALAKVKRFIPADRAKEIELKANQIYIDLSPWMGNRNIQPYLERVKTALQESRLLSFEYADRFGNKTVRTVEPVSYTHLDVYKRQTQRMERQKRDVD